MKPIQLANSLDAFASLGVVPQHEEIKVWCVCARAYVILEPCIVNAAILAWLNHSIALALKQD